MMPVIALRFRAYGLVVLRFCSGFSKALHLDLRIEGSAARTESGGDGETVGEFDERYVVDGITGGIVPKVSLLMNHGDILSF